MRFLSIALRPLVPNSCTQLEKKRHVYLFIFFFFYFWERFFSRLPKNTGTWKTRILPVPNKIGDAGSLVPCRTVFSDRIAPLWIISARFRVGLPPENFVANQIAPGNKWDDLHRQNRSSTVYLARWVAVRQQGNPSISRSCATAPSQCPMSEQNRTFAFGHLPDWVVGERHPEWCDQFVTLLPS